MSVESISKVLNSKTGVSPLAKMVLLGIANHDGDGGAWPSVATLARYAEVSTRSVQRALADLEQAGLIERHLNQGGTARSRDHSRPNLYVITLSGGDTVVTPPGDTPVTPPVTQVSPEPSLNASVEPSTPYSPPTGEVEVVDEWEVFFNQFWDVYPRKVAKPAAKRAMKARYGSFDTHAMADGTNAWIRFWEMSKTEEQFIPHPSTFLNQERYNDIPPVTVSSKPESAMDIIRRIAERDQ